MCTEKKMTSMIMMFQRAMSLMVGKNSADPKIISATPLQKTIALGAGMYGGIIF